jgi:hypothetical protein
LLGDNRTEAYHNECDGKLCGGIEDKVVAIRLEISTYCCHLRQEEIVQQIDI